MSENLITGGFFIGLFLLNFPWLQLFSQTWSHFSGIPQVKVGAQSGVTRAASFRE